MLHCLNLCVEAVVMIKLWLSSKWTKLMMTRWGWWFYQLEHLIPIHKQHLWANPLLLLVHIPMMRTPILWPFWGQWFCYWNPTNIVIYFTQYDDWFCMVHGVTRCEYRHWMWISSWGVIILENAEISVVKALIIWDLTQHESHSLISWYDPVII